MKRRGELVKVGDLFSHYRSRIIAPQASVVSVFVEVVADICTITLKLEQVSYKVTSRTIVLHTPSILKHEIMRHKADVLLHCQGRLGVKSAPKEIV
jgi:hypothetical protein